MWKPTVLMITDERKSVMLLSDFLAGFNPTILLAEDGEVGLKMAGDTQPDLILLDMVMPGADGYGLCHRLKSLKSTSNIPVIIVVDPADADRRIKGFEAGADDYLSRPFLREEVLARVGGRLRNLELINKFQETKESLEKRIEDRLVELRDSERRLADIIDFLPDATFVIDLEGKITLWNRAAEKFTGAKAEDMLGKGDHEYSIPYYGVRRPVLIDLVLNPSPEIEKLYPFVRRENGMVIGESYTRSIRHGEAYILGIAAPLYDSEGNIIGAIESVRDITERKKAEVALQESEWKFRAIFDQQFQFMGLLTVNGTTLSINRTALRFAGVEEPEVIGKPFWKTPWWTHSPDQQERLRAAIKAAAHGEVLSYETTHPAADGSLHYIDFSLKPVKDEKGKVVFLVPEGRDITERKIAENALRESEWKFRAIFDQQFQLMGLLTVDGTTIQANQTALSLSGVEESDILGKPFWETPWWVHSTELQDKLRQAVKKVAEGEHVSFEATHPAPDGTLHYIDFSLKPVKDETGKVVFLVPEGHDITERKLSEAAQREAAIKYRIVADNTYNWEFWLSPLGQFIYTSPSCQRISGHDAEEFSANPGLVWDIVHQDDRQLLTDHRHDITQTKALGEVEFRIVRPDREIRWIHHVCEPVFDDSGNYLGTRGSFSDITNRRLAEEKNLRLAAIVESSDDAIIGKTMDGDITSWNRGAEKIFNYEESEVLGKPITILIPPEYVDDVLKVHERIRRGEHVEHFETVRRKKDGERIYMSLTYSPIRDAQGKVIAMSTIGRDITEQKRAAAALLDNARIKRELEIAKEIQQSFLPVCPSALPGMFLTCCCVPTAHVGGDYYDFFSLEAGIVDAVIADVTGHSIGSSLLMTMTRSVLHAKVSSSRTPGTLLAAVNDLLYDDLSRAELLLSMFYVRLDPKNRTLAYSNAGHNHPFLYRSREGAFMELDAEGLLMGVRTDVSFEEKVTRVDAGDILILYTDGVTEAENANGELFGTERLCGVIASHYERHPKDIMAEIFKELTGFTLSDDVAMIIFKIV
jgi:sigma-B regulation protein RsbU (phosphoserine phosphatase)